MCFYCARRVSKASAATRGENISVSIALDNLKREHAAQSRIVRDLEAATKAAEAAATAANERMTEMALASAPGPSIASGRASTGGAVPTALAVPAQPMKRRRSKSSVRWKLAGTRAKIKAKNDAAHRNSKPRLERRASIGSENAGMGMDDVAAEMRRLKDEHEAERAALQEAELYSRQKQQERLQRQLAERRQNRKTALRKKTMMTSSRMWGKIRESHLSSNDLTSIKEGTRASLTALLEHKKWKEGITRRPSSSSNVVVQDRRGSTGSRSVVRRPSLLDGSSDDVNGHMELEQDAFHEREQDYQRQQARAQEEIRKKRERRDRRHQRRRSSRPSDDVAADMAAAVATVAPS